MLSVPNVVPIQWRRRTPRPATVEPCRASRAEVAQRINSLLAHEPALAERYHRVVDYQRGLRVSEYHLTNACNIRCKGCWFFEHEFDQSTREVKDLDEIEAFAMREATQRKINMALVIGGEPTMFPKRLAVFVKHMRHVSISTNGLEKLPVEGFDNVMIGVTLFGGGPLDDELRAIKPGGKRFEGLFETALGHYKNDHRVNFVYAVTENGIAHIEPTVRRIHANGNQVIFNFYSDYSKDERVAVAPREELVRELLRVRARYPRTVLSHPYTIRTMVTGRSHWDEFGYETCASLSRDHPGNAARLANGNPSLPVFNAFAADLKNVALCSSSGRCESCREGQAVTTWLLVNRHRFTDSIEYLRTWVEIAESWWSQFCWSPFHRSARVEAIAEAA